MVGEFNAMIYILPIRAEKVSAMYKICELAFQGMREKNIDYSYFIRRNERTISSYLTSSVTGI